MQYISHWKDTRSLWCKQPAWDKNTVAHLKDLRGKKEKNLHSFKHQDF